MQYRITVDVGGTFTDVVVADELGHLTIGKSPTTEPPFAGILGGLETAAEQLELAVEALLGDTSVFIYSGTRATNAIVENKTGKTAFLCTEGFPDTLVLREGGKFEPFNLSIPFPEPYVPRHLTFEIPERVSAEGEILRPLDEDATRNVLMKLKEKHIEAVAVCFLWSVMNGSHERRLGELIEEMLPGVPYTLSHVLNPIVREYRRASSTAIDASLKPFMGPHLQEVVDGLHATGFTGEVMAATTLGGVMHIEDVVARPIDAVKSGPSMAPVAAKTYAEAESRSGDVIVADAGGTTFDVSLIRNGAIKYASETWLGPQFTGHMLGTSSVDIRSIGSGGGSIAWVDSGGLLRVGPQSAGSVPGPACYGRGGDRPTVTDAAVVLGYLDPAGFLGGRMLLDEAAAEAVLAGLGSELGLSAQAAADAVLVVANEHMVRAIQDITINEGVDPKEAVFVAGGGAAGLSLASIIRELGCREALMPRTAGALSATGAQFSDIIAEFNVARFVDSYAFDLDAVSAAFDELEAKVEDFAAGLRARGVTETWTDYFVDARYAYQVYLLEVPLDGRRFRGEEDVAALCKAFDEAHERVFAVSEPGARVECLTWRARLHAPVGRAAIAAVAAELGHEEGAVVARTRREAVFDGRPVETPIYLGRSLPLGMTLQGPAIIEEPTSTLVVPPDARVRVTSLDNYLLEV